MERIFQAVSYIGTETARRVLLAAAIRGNFSSPQAHQLWNHSLDVAQTAELVAMHSSVKIDPSQAFLAGLIHDIGRLAFAIMPVAFQERFQRLTDGGCPPVEVEMCLSGRCHGEVGAETLAQWKFPAEIIEAVRWHHRPERSELPLSSLLYLAEFVTESQEDLPSYVRMNTATRVAGISMELLARDPPEERGVARKLALRGLSFLPRYAGLRRSLEHAPTHSRNRDRLAAGPDLHRRTIPIRARDVRRCHAAASRDFLPHPADLAQSPAAERARDSSGPGERPFACLPARVARPTEHRTRHGHDSFWTWRESMYHAANRLSPEGLYHASRMAFLEMLLGGITTVGNSITCIMPPTDGLRGSK